MENHVDGMLLKSQAEYAPLIFACYNRAPGNTRAKVAELVDALDLGSSASRRKSSSLFFRTNNINQLTIRLAGFLLDNLSVRFKQMRTIS